MSVTVGYLSDNLLTNRGTIACTCKGCRDVSSGNKNSPHANQKKKEANGDRYEEYKRQYDKLKSSPNKTPEVKKQIEKLGDYIRHYPKYTKHRLTQQIRRCFIL